MGREFTCKLIEMTTQVIKTIKGTIEISWGLFRIFYSLFPRFMAEKMFTELSSFQPTNITKEEVAELHAMIKLQRSGKGFVNDLEQNIDQNIIGEIICPTIILHSSKDKAVNIDHAKYAHTKIKKSILKVYDNRWGHLLWLGQESNIPIEDTLEFIDKDYKSQPVIV